MSKGDRCDSQYREVSGQNDNLISQGLDQSWTNNNVILSDSGAEVLSPSMGRSVEWPGLLRACGAWSSELLRGLVGLWGAWGSILYDPCVIIATGRRWSQRPFLVSFYCPSLDPSCSSTYLESTGRPSHTTGCGVGRHRLGAPSPSAWPLLAMNAGRGPATHCWPHLDM